MKNFFEDFENEKSCCRTLQFRSSPHDAFFAKTIFI